MPESHLKNEQNRDLLIEYGLILKQEADLIERKLKLFAKMEESDELKELTHDTMVYEDELDKINVILKVFDIFMN